MKKFLLSLSILIFFFFSLANAQGNQTVNNGTSTAPVTFPGGGCVYNWVNDNPGIGLAASGTGNIGSFKAVNNGSSPINSTITGTPASVGFAYITNSGDGTISVINVAANSIVATITPPKDPFSVCISPDGTKVYIGCGGSSSTVTVINAITDAIITTITANPAGESNGIAVSPDGTMLYIADYVTGTVSVINTATNTVVAVITVGKNPYGLAINPDGSKVYVANSGSNDVSIIGTATNAIIATITVGLAPQDLVVSPDGSRLYVTILGASNVSVINTISNSIIALVPTSNAPSAIALSPDGAVAYVATNSNNVSVISTSTNAVISTIAVGAGSNGVCVSPDGHSVYVTNTESNNVSVINTSTNTVTATVNVGIAPISLGNFVTAGSGCTVAPIKLTITVNPTLAALPPAISASVVTGTISACVGTASVSPKMQQLVVSGSNLTGNLVVTAPTNFEVSLTTGGGFGGSLAFAQTGGTVNNTVVYIRSAANAPAGNISGNLSLTSPGASTVVRPVTGTVNALPTVNAVANQTVLNGAPTTAVNFSGTGNALSWVNDTPGIGLAPSGTGNISS